MHLSSKIKASCLLISSIFFFSLPLKGFAECCRGPFVVQASLLYWTPSYDETYFVINGSDEDGTGHPTPYGCRIQNPVDYNFGFRLEGAYGFRDSCVDFRLRWTHIYSSSKKTVINTAMVPQLWPTEIIPSLPNVSAPYSGRAISHIGVMHQRGEGLFNEGVWNNSCCHFSLRQAVEWSYIRYQENVKYVEIQGLQEKIEFHGHTKGIGPQIGATIVCDPWSLFRWCPRNLALKCMTTGSLIVANTKSKVRATDILGKPNKVTQKSIWRLVPEWNLSFGINYCYAFGLCRASLEVAYEMATYFRGVSKLLFNNAESPGLSINQYSDFYTHGVNVTFSLIF